MAKILSEERVLEYSREFKVMVVKLSDLEEIKIKTLSECLGLHPLMVSRWRKEVRDGKLVSDETRRVRMTLESASKSGKKAKQTKTKTQKLEAENKRLKKEVDLLKKWHGYLAEVRQKDSDL